MILPRGDSNVGHARVVTKLCHSNDPAGRVISTSLASTRGGEREKRKVFLVHCRGWKPDMIGPSVSFCVGFIVTVFHVLITPHTVCMTIAQGHVFSPLFAYFQIAMVHLRMSPSNPFTLYLYRIRVCHAACFMSPDMRWLTTTLAYGIMEILSPSVSPVLYSTGSHVQHCRVALLEL